MPIRTTGEITITVTATADPAKYDCVVAWPGGSRSYTGVSVPSSLGASAKIDRAAIKGLALAWGEVGDLSEKSELTSTSRRTLVVMERGNAGEIPFLTDIS